MLSSKALHNLPAVPTRVRLSRLSTVSHLFAHGQPTSIHESAKKEKCQQHVCKIFWQVRAFCGSVKMPLGVLFQISESLSHRTISVESLVYNYIRIKYMKCKTPNSSLNSQGWHSYSQYLLFEFFLLNFGKSVEPRRSLIDHHRAGLKVPTIANTAANKVEGGNVLTGQKLCEKWTRCLHERRWIKIQSINLLAETSTVRTHAPSFEHGQKCKTVAEMETQLQNDAFKSSLNNRIRRKNGKWRTRLSKSKLESCNLPPNWLLLGLTRCLLWLCVLI